MISAILAMILLPLAMALLLAWAPARRLVVQLLWLAPAPALVLLASAWDGAATSLPLAGGWTFVLDQPGAIMLAAASLLWIIGGLAARRWLTGRAGATRFAVWWLLTLSGSLGVLVAGDVVSFYALYALASLPAYGLIAFAGGDADRRAGRLALAAALIGEGLILAACVLLATGATGQGLDIAGLLRALPGAPHCGVVIALVVAGFGLKIGLVPLHGWMPPSYAAGPLAATAVLSGATSKAGIIGLIRFLPLDTAMPVAGGLILAAGLFSAFYGAVLGLTQHNARSVLAYSSISQLGQLAAVLGAGLAAGTPSAATLAAFAAAYHVLTKGGLFLMLGTRRQGGALPGWNVVLTSVMALGFAGLPPTGGGLGKLALKEVTGSGATGLLFSLAAIGSTVLMLHFLRRVAAEEVQHVKDALPGAPWVMAAAAASLLPWALFAPVTGIGVAQALAPGAILGLLWPVAAGALLAGVHAARGPRLPRLQPGDVAAKAAAALEGRARQIAALTAWFEARAAQWPVSSLALATGLVIFVLLQLWARGA